MYEPTPRRLTQKYVDQMLTKGDQERLRTGVSKGYGFGNHSDVIVWEGDHFEEISPAAYHARLRAAFGGPPCECPHCR
jgi:hypothetical protein